MKRFKVLLLVVEVTLVVVVERRPAPPRGFRQGKEEGCGPLTGKDDMRGRNRESILKRSRGE